MDENRYVVEAGHPSQLGFGVVGTNGTWWAAFSRRWLMMVPAKGPNRLNMKFTKSGTKLVIHLVRGLPPKLSRDKKTITITFLDDSRSRGAQS